MKNDWDGFETYEIGDEIHLNFEVVVHIMTKDLTVNKKILEGHLKRYIKFILSEEKYEGPCVI